MKTKKAVLFILYILLGMVAAGMAFSRFWRTRSQVLSEEKQLNLRASPTPANPIENADQGNQAVVPAPEEPVDQNQAASAP